MDGHAAADMGLSAKDLSDLVASFNWIQAKAYSEILKRGKFSWNQFWNGGDVTGKGEKTAWDFSRHRETGFDIVTINPPFVLGQNLDKASTPDELNESSSLVYKWLTGKMQFPPNG